MAKCFQWQMEAAWKPRRGCEGVWHLMMEWEGGLSFTRCGTQVQIVLLRRDWWRRVHRPLRGRDEEREGVRVYRPQQIDVRPRTASENPRRGRQAVVYFVCVHHARLDTAFSLPSTALWLVLFCLLTPRFWEFQKSRKTRAAFRSSNCPKGGGKKSLQFSCQWVLLRRRPSIKRLTEPARRIASTTHWGSAGTQLFECNSSNHNLFKDSSAQSVGSSPQESSAWELVKLDGAWLSGWALLSRSR